MLVRSLTVVILLSVGQSVQGLSCYTCVDYNLRSSDTLVNMRLKSNPEDQACRDDDRSRMKSVECTAQQTKCVKTYVEASAKYLGKTIEGTTVIRGCVQTNASLPTGCKTTTDETELQQMLRLPISITSFEATACVCSGNMCNGQTRVVSNIIPSLTGTALIWVLHASQ